MQSMGPRTPASKTSILAVMDENRKRLGFGRDNTFVATPNVRNPAMMVEAEAFSHHLDKFERAVREYHKRVQGCVRGLLPLLDSNLPRVWLSVDEASGLAEPLRPSISHGHPSRVGGEYDMDAMNRYLDRLDRGIQEDVLLPLRRWQEGLAVAKVRALHEFLVYNVIRFLVLLLLLPQRLHASAAGGCGPTDHRTL
eukprot:GHRQ01035930.1.p2 GENE.GHRQ01035930.1~~GHRQ01035930.1.p2  ORF type:complete len:196 (-),score=60.32 GHRQ01035930.1:100-687(-)